MDCTLTEPHIVCHDIPFNRKIVGAVSCHRRGITVMEGTVSDVGGLDIRHSASIDEGYGTARIPGINVSFLSTAHKLHVGNPGIS